MKKIIILAVAFLMVSPGLFAQWKAGKQDNTQHTVLYACPTNSNVIVNTPGKCPICGMDLNLSQKEQLKAQVTKTYTCPVYADNISNKAGRNLNLSLKEKMKMEVVKLNNIPVHATVAGNKSDKCPNCGMNVVQQKTKSKNG